MLKIISVVGAPGVGKSTVCKQLVKSLGIDYMYIDSYRRMNGYNRETAWNKLIKHLRLKDWPVMVESNVIPASFAKFLKRRPYVVIQLVCNEKVRRQRLRTLGETCFKTYPIRLRPNHEFDSDVALKPMLQVVQDFIERV